MSPTMKVAHSWVSDKAIPAHKVGRLWKFRAIEVDESVRFVVGPSGCELDKLTSGASGRCIGRFRRSDRFCLGNEEVHILVNTPRYALSFTSGALLVREALIAAPLYLRERDWSNVRRLMEEDNLLQSRTHSSGVRLTREVTQRLAVLSDAEIELLIEASPTERGYLMWGAACRRYDLIGEFAEEVLRERFLVLGTTLDYDDFDSFIRSKALWHDELAGLKESTLRRLRSNVFRMLVEAEMLTDDGRIVRVVLSSRLTDVLASDIRFFPTGGAT